jgi:hypothetical protein
MTNQKKCRESAMRAEQHIQTSLRGLMELVRAGVRRSETRSVIDRRSAVDWQNAVESKLNDESESLGES